MKSILIVSKDVNKIYDRIAKAGDKGGSQWETEQEGYVTNGYMVAFKKSSVALEDLLVKLEAKGDILTLPF